MTLMLKGRWEGRCRRIQLLVASTVAPTEGFASPKFIRLKCHPLVLPAVGSGISWGGTYVRLFCLRATPGNSVDACRGFRPIPSIVLDPNCSCGPSRARFATDGDMGHTRRGLLASNESIVRSAWLLPPLPDGYVCHARELHGDSAIPRFPHNVDNVYVHRTRFLLGAIISRGG